MKKTIKAHFFKMLLLNILIICFPIHIKSQIDTALIDSLVFKHLQKFKNKLNLEKDFFEKDVILFNGISDLYYSIHQDSNFIIEARKAMQFCIEDYFSEKKANNFSALFSNLLCLKIAKLIEIDSPYAIDYLKMVKSHLFNVVWANKVLRNSLKTHLYDFDSLRLIMNPTLLETMLKKMNKKNIINTQHFLEAKLVNKKIIVKIGVIDSFEKKYVIELYHKNGCFSIINNYKIRVYNDSIDPIFIRIEPRGFEPPIWIIRRYEYPGGNDYFYSTLKMKLYQLNKNLDSLKFTIVIDEKKGKLNIYKFENEYPIVLKDSIISIFEKLYCRPGKFYRFNTRSIIKISFFQKRNEIEISSYDDIKYKKIDTIINSLYRRGI